MSNNDLYKAFFRVDDFCVGGWGKNSMIRASINIKKEQAITKDMCDSWTWQRFSNDIEEVNLWSAATRSSEIFNAIGSVALHAFYAYSNESILYLDNTDIVGYGGGVDELLQKERWGLFFALLKQLNVRELRFTANKVYNAKYLPNTVEVPCIRDGARWGYTQEHDEKITAFVYFDPHGKWNVFYDIIKCRQCGEYHQLSYSELDWLKKHEYRLPSRCRGCRGKLKAGK